MHFLQLVPDIFGVRTVLHKNEAIPNLVSKHIVIDDFSACMILKLNQREAVCELNLWAWVPLAQIHR